MKRLLLILTLLSSILYIEAQDTEFWFVAPDLSEQANCGPFDSPIMLAISNVTNTAGVVTIIFYNGGSPITVTNPIPANGVWKYDITDAMKGQIENPRNSAGNITKYGVHITSSVRITAFYQVLSPCNQDVWVLKGTSALGTNFYVPMVHDSYYHTGDFYTRPIPYDQIDIVATVDGTQVTVVPRKDIRIGVSGSSPAGFAITRTLNKGETLKIMENISGQAIGTPSLGGTKITSTKPIAVTTTEDLIGRMNGGTGWDVIGDQIVPVESLGKNYIVTKGFLQGSDRTYMVATQNGTTISVNYGSGMATSGVLNAGDNWVYALGTGGNVNAAPQAMSITANYPIYCYHVSGVKAPGDELGSGLLPSIYSIGQTEMSFYQYSSDPASDKHYGFVVFRTGTHNNFSIKIGTGAAQALAVTPIAIPGNAEWQAAKITLPANGQNKVVTIRNTESPFSLGYFFANFAYGGASYGYLTAFGEFRFPYDTIYKCPDAPVKLAGGYATTYKWKYSPDSYSGPYTTLNETTSSITVTKDGFYALEMNQDPKLVHDTVLVCSIVPKILPETTDPISTIFSINSELVNDPNLKITYNWTFTGGTPASSTDAKPLVTWTSGERTASVSITATANSPRSTGGCSTSISKKYYEIEPLKQPLCVDFQTPLLCNFTLPGGPNTYQWQISYDNITWENIAGATSKNYTPSTNYPGYIYYRVIVSNGTETIYSKSEKVMFRLCSIPVNPNIHMSNNN